MTDTVTVLIENTYACGRESEFTRTVTAPPAGVETAVVNSLLDAWWDDRVHDLTGDGHPCGSREWAYYEATITEAPGRPELVGQSYSWEG